MAKKKSKAWNKGLTKETDEGLKKGTGKRKKTNRNNPKIITDRNKKRAQTIKVYPKKLFQNMLSKLYNYKYENNEVVIEIN